ncbi:SIS domain-containing protein [Luminiphilus sp.]|nr:SIS domain-containing protein [Luminiphilus sp.]
MEYIRAIRGHLDQISDAAVEGAASLIASAKSLHLFGNGGSAAICSHVSVDLTKACGLKARTYHDSALLTCFANDYGYENAYAKIVEKFVAPEDCVVLISSSGMSLNILNAASAAKQKGASLVTLSGFLSDNGLRKFPCDQHCYIPSDNYNVVETMHLIMLLSVAEVLRLQR